MPETQPVPSGYHSVTPHLIFKSADAAIKFYERAFGAREIMRLNGPNGGVAHAEIEIEKSRIMMADESPMMGNKSAELLGGSPVSFMIYIPDVDAAFAKALSAGATVKRPVEDPFYGDRTGTLVDPFGMVWSMGTHKEDVSFSDMKERLETMLAPASAS